MGLFEGAEQLGTFTSSCLLSAPLKLDWLEFTPERPEFFPLLVHSWDDTLTHIK